MNPPRPLKVLVVDDAPGRASWLRSRLSSLASIQLAGVVETSPDLCARLAEHDPDLVLVDADSPTRSVLEQLTAASASAPRPVVIFADDSRASTIRAAIRAGACAYIPEAIRPERLEAVLRVAIERFEAERAMRAELVQTKAQLADRKVIERAKGIVMKQRGVSEEEAFRALRSLAMEHSLRLGDAARRVIDVAGLLA